jgi:surfactin synthase thioesterase subunit
VGGAILTNMVARIRSSPKAAPSAVSSPEKMTPKLFCVAFAGGDSRAYAGLKAALREVEIVPLERAGHGRRSPDPLLTDGDAAVSDLFAELVPRIDGPFALYGHSLGARLAYLLARRLDGHEHLIHLFVSGEAAPSCRTREQDTWSLPSEALWQRLAAMGGLPPELLEHPDLMSYYEPVVRGDLELLARLQYREETPLEVPITVMIGDQEAVTLAEARRWQNETVHPLTLRMFDGGHFFIRQHWNEIAHLMEGRLGAAFAPRRGGALPA